MGYTWNGWTRGCRDAKFCVSTVGVRVYNLICGTLCPPWWTPKAPAFSLMLEKEVDFC